MWVKNCKSSDHLRECKVSSESGQKIIRLHNQILLKTPLTQMVRTLAVFDTHPKVRYHSNCIEISFPKSYYMGVYLSWLGFFRVFVFFFSMQNGKFIGIKGKGGVKPHFKPLWYFKQFTPLLSQHWFQESLPVPTSAMTTTKRKELYVPALITSAMKPYPGNIRSHP